SSSTHASSGSCSSTRRFAPRFFRAPPRGGHPCVSLVLHLHQVGQKTLTSKLSCMLGTPTVLRRLQRRRSSHFEVLRSTPSHPPPLRMTGSPSPGAPHTRPQTPPRSPSARRPSPAAACHSWRSGGDRRIASWGR